MAERVTSAWCGCRSAVACDVHDDDFARWSSSGIDAAMRYPVEVGIVDVEVSYRKGVSACTS